MPLNRKFVVRALSLLGCAAFATSAVAAESGGPKVADYTLSNGLELVVIPDHRAPVVTHMIWYKVGAADETPGKSGLAHFLEHLMFKGTAKNPAGKFSQVVARIGGQENAFTSNDYTGYFQRVPSDQLKTVMEFEADRMTGLQLTDAVVLPERDVILEERNQRMENNPRARLSEQIEAALFLNHPYGKPVIGWRHEMEGLTRDDAIGFYRRFYGPNNAVVVIAGDVDPAEAKKLAEDTYGKVGPRSAIPPRNRPQEPPPAAVRSLTLADPRVEMPTLQRDYLVPSFHTAKPGESPALEVLSSILGGGSNSRLYRALVVDKSVAVSAGAWYDSSAFDMSKFGVYGAPREGVTLPQLESAIDAVIADVIDKGVTAEELDRVKTRLIADAVYAQDNQATMARWYGSALTTGGTVKDVQGWSERIRAVSAQEVQDAARKWLDKRRSVTGYLIKDTSPQPERRS
ncbi:M16 family metallopeptidase [Pseudolabrys taiwanensis]|uniref:M16 family metallopeptidase n=1 Tax=Pseudolabrys taiwanensis TaxID=331696 RepID=UPI001FE06E9C|nr:pitrilysin family protein [Pseudolabrys taiwanensis]